MDGFLSATEVARRLGVSRSWLYEQVKHDRIPHVRLTDDGPVRFIEADLEAWLAERRRGWRPSAATLAS